ncbi:MAG: hypothetical protein KDA58_08765 [Planctomycetaceae bacterium]|nr:hypothetical protein [Planctomycetaceae bacterium]
MRVLTGSHHLRNLFAALTEQTFQVEFGFADPPLIDYLSEMLVRFVRFESIFKARDVVGQRLEEVADMLREANEREGRPQRELHRHIGDFALFWTGVYPEALKYLRRWDRQDAMIDYQSQGKRSYYIASTIPDKEREDETRILRRLSDQFEICSAGLHQVRKEWDACRA